MKRISAIGQLFGFFGVGLMLTACGSDSDFQRFRSMFGEGTVRSQQFEVQSAGERFLISRLKSDDTGLEQRLEANAAAPTLTMNELAGLKEVPGLGVRVVREVHDRMEIFAFLTVMPWHEDVSDVSVRVYLRILLEQEELRYSFLLRQSDVMALSSIVQKIAEREGFPSSLP